MWARKNGEARGKWVRAEKCSCNALPVARPALRIAFARLSLEEGERKMCWSGKQLGFAPHSHWFNKYHLLLPPFYSSSLTDTSYFSSCLPVVRVSCVQEIAAGCRLCRWLVIRTHVSEKCVYEITVITRVGTSEKQVSLSRTWKISRRFPDLLNLLNPGFHSVLRPRFLGHTIGLCRRHGT